MSLINYSGEVPESSNDATINGVQKPVARYNLDDFALPKFVLKALKIIAPPEVRTWRELADYVRANSRILPPLTLECLLKIQHDYSNAGPAERTSVIPALTPTIRHLPLRAANPRGGMTLHGAVTANPNKTNSNVRGATQSQGLAQIAIGPRESPPNVCRGETISANVGAASGFASGITREQQLAGVCGVPDLSRKHPTQVLRKEATSAKMIASTGHPRVFPELSRKEAIPTWSSAPGAHRENPSQTGRKEATPAYWGAAPGAHREQPWRKENAPANFNAAPGAHREHPSLTSRKEAVPVITNAPPGAHREHAPTQFSHKEFSRKEAMQSNWRDAPEAHGENSPQVSRKEAIPIDWSAARRAHREKSSQASLQEAIPMNSAASSGLPRQPPSETPPKEAIPAKVGAAPAILLHGASKQKVISPATAAAFEQAKTAMANSAKDAPQGMQKPATRDTAKGDQSSKSMSINSNTNEKTKSIKSASKDQVIGKGEAETEEKAVTPMGELIDVSIPTRSPPPAFQPVHLHYLNGYTTTGGNNPLMPAIAAIPALIPVKKSDLHPPMQSPHLRKPVPAMLPPATPPTLSRHSSSTRSESSVPYTRTPSAERPKAPNPAAPKQAGRYYLVYTDGDVGYDYVWVQGAQPGDPCPPHLNPVE